MKPLEALVTVQEAAALMQVNEQTLRKWAREGRLPCLRVGSRIRFRRIVLSNWLEGRVTGKEARR